MILQALYEYYNILEQAGEISRPGYAPVKVRFALELLSDGMLAGIYPLRDEVTHGKKTMEVPKVIRLPQPVKRTVGIEANYLYDNSSYVLGADNKGKPQRSRACFEAFRERHHALLDATDDPAAKALLAFLDRWNPEEVEECQVIAPYLEELLAGANIIFQLQGHGYLHEMSALLDTWDVYNAIPSIAELQPCLVSGKLAPAARLHPNLKGVRGGQSSGISLVSFNASAYESYGKDGAQGLNAPVSERAAFAYATALNHLLSNSETCIQMGDTTVVFWAQSSQKNYARIFTGFLNPPIQEESAQEEDKFAEAELFNILRRVSRGEPINFCFELDPDVRFCILGLAPNAARAAVRFFHADSFGNIISNLARHFADIEIEHSSKKVPFLPLWVLLDETVSSNDTDKKSRNLLSGATARAVIMGTPYPRALFNAAMLRIKAERDVTRGKAAIIKAYLLRQPNFEYKEECQVSLNKESTNQAYVLGRLFAVLEKAQKDAQPGINTTIKDRYFTSACAAPRATFPVLLKLAQHHMAKTEYGGVSERRVAELMDKLNVENDPFPAQLGLEQQGLFVLGYYHQNNENYRSKKEEN